MDKQEALDIIRKNWPNGRHQITEALKTLIPELTEESEDEKIRKYIINHFQGHLDTCNRFISDGMFPPFSASEMKMLGASIAWLEKQGEQKPVDKIQIGKEYKCIASPRYSAFMIGEIYKPEDKFLCSLMNFYSDCFEPIEDGEQKSTNKVKPKFKVGDWVVQAGFGTYKVLEVCESWYEVIDIEDNHYSISFNNDFMCHLWTIHDAKPGDVLNSTRVHATIIFKDFDIDGRHINAYCAIQQGFFLHQELPWDGDFEPAPKKWKDELFQKMNEKGYEWDSEKKELKKIETNPTWSEEDEKMYAATIFALAGFMGNEDKINWIESLKERIIPQQKQEWSEEDENRFRNLTYLVEHSNEGKGTKEGFVKFINRLKFIKERYTWKPSEEQMKALKEACDEHWEPDGLDPLYTLYEDLKKLKD